MSLKITRGFLYCMKAAHKLINPISIVFQSSEQFVFCYSFIPHIFFGTRLCIVFLLKNWNLLFFLSNLSCKSLFFPPRNLSRAIPTCAWGNFWIFGFQRQVKNQERAVAWDPKMCLSSCCSVCVHTSTSKRVSVMLPPVGVGLLLMFLKQLRRVSKNHTTKGS